MINFHKVDNISFDKKTMTLAIDNQEYKFDLARVSKRLLEANEEERKTLEISPSGYGIHWPLIDEDLSVEGLLKLVN